ncbi:hypothetical protein IFM89_020470 [Coptis chinensis]|uniref:Protein kinase domain-containing protein n=1 Tax=Coptis chinensis TaxID=261450 RepID=A0A835H5A6_9MAGN|nr:hypothetical protein IFM89_020470 [Coptis chinensis]
MKCFHFSNGEKRDDRNNNEDGTSFSAVSRFSKVSWARSLSVASKGIGTARRANHLRIFAFSELKSATRGFSRGLMIGEGGFGCVYKGVVAVSADDAASAPSKMDVAVKQLNRNGLQAIWFVFFNLSNSFFVILISSFQGHKEWITEVNCLGVVKHPNLVKLVGYCAEDDERGIQRLLVYELMPNKSLEDHLLTRVPHPLPWPMRLKIVYDAARGLAYLHEEMDFQLIFRDFKTSNILLDEDFNAKLSDFGLARQGPSEGLGHVSTSVVGTVGYAAPEYVQTGRLTTKSDVWSFGVVLYELITGRRSVDRNLPRNEQKLLEWVKPKSAQKLVGLANKCLMKQPNSRPKMSEVVEILGQIISETASSSDVAVSQPIEEVETAKQKEDNVLNTDSTKQGSSYRRVVFDLKRNCQFKK